MRKPSRKEVKKKENDEKGLSIDFGSERYNANSYDALALIYGDKQGRIYAIEIKSQAGPDGPEA